MPRNAWRDAARIRWRRPSGGAPASVLSGCGCDGLGIPCWYQAETAPLRARAATCAGSHPMGGADGPGTARRTRESGAGASVKNRLRGVLRLLAEMDRADPGRRGCMAVNTAAEPAGTYETATELARCMSGRAEDAFRAVVQEGRRGGEVSADRDAAAIGACCRTPSSVCVSWPVSPKGREPNVVERRREPVRPPADTSSCPDARMRGCPSPSVRVPARRPPSPPSRPRPHPGRPGTGSAGSASDPPGPFRQPAGAVAGRILGEGAR